MIAKEFDVPALSIEHPVEEYTDILFLGGGVYGWKMDDSLCEFIKQLPKEKVGQIIAFSTTGFMESTLKQIRQEAEQKGIKVNENELLVKMMLRGHSMLGLEGGNLKKEQQEKVQEFVKVIQKEIE